MNRSSNRPEIWSSIWCWPMWLASTMLQTRRTMDWVCGPLATNCWESSVVAASVEIASVSVVVAREGVRNIMA